MRFPVAARGAVIAAVFLVWTSDPSAKSQTEAALSNASHTFGVIASGERTAAQDIAIDDASEVQIDVISPIRLSVEITRPDGSQITPGNAEAFGVKLTQFSVADLPGLIVTPGLRAGEHTVAILQSPPSGTYVVRVNAQAPVPDRTPFVISTYVESDISLAVRIPEPETIAGAPVVVTAVALQGTGPISNGTIVASFREVFSNDGRVPAVITVQLLDNGANADALVGDNVYTGVLPSGLTAGNYVVLVHAEGTSPSGARFKRDSSAELRVTERTSRILRVASAAGVDDNGNGLFDRLRVSVDVEVGSAGEFTLSLLLQGSNGRTTGSNKVGQLAEGNRTIDVDFPADYILSLATDAPYTVGVARLDQLTTSERLLRDKLLNGGVVSGYRLAQFDGFSPPTQLGDVNRDGRVDCTDVAILRASFGRRTGQPGFDPMADVNTDGIVNIVDLTLVSRRLPTGTRCP